MTVKMSHRDTYNGTTAMNSSRVATMSWHAKGCLNRNTGEKT